MTTVICPKCGSENPSDAVNCMKCQSILTLGQEHAEKQEVIASIQGEANDRSSDMKGGILKKIESSSILQILVGFIGWFISICIINLVQLHSINQFMFRMIWLDIVFGIIPGVIGGVIGWFIGSKWNREKRVLITTLGAIFGTFFRTSVLLYVWPILWIIGGAILWLVGHSWTQKKRVLVAILGPLVAILILLIPVFFMMLALYQVYLIEN